MRKLLVGMLLLGGVIAIIAVIARRRSGSGLDEWDSFAEDSLSPAQQSIAKATDAAEDSVSKTADAARDV